jgi:hypothetical protein
MDSDVRAWLPFAWLLLVAAGLVAVVAQGFGSILCENGCEGELGTVRYWQQLLPVLGLFPTALFVAFLHKGRGREAMIMLMIAVVIFCAWGVALELLTHPEAHGVDRP